jgi:hypothetical protein
MSSKPASADRMWKASELRRLPSKQRDRILTEAAASAEEAYRTDQQLTDFEAYGEDDLHGQSATAAER